MTDSLSLVKEAVIECPYVEYPFDNGERITMDNIETVENKRVACHIYVFHNNTDDYAFLWFGQEKFNLYMNRPLFPLSIMSMIYEYGSTLVMDPQKAFITPFLTFYKIVEPKEKFRIYIYDENNEFSEDIIYSSIRYIRRDRTFLVDAEQTFGEMLNWGYRNDEILLSVKSFIRQPVWIKGEGLKLMDLSSGGN